MAVGKSLAADDRELVARFERAGQGHVFGFLGALSGAETEELFADARRVDLDRVAALVAHDAAAKAATGSAPLPPGDELLRLDRGEAHAKLRAEARAAGIEELRAGRVAVIVVAGGQGTRLGHSAPKGLWPVGPLTGKPLLAWHAEKVLHWSRRVGRPIPFVLLVSDATARPTEDFLRWHKWCGLDPTWVRTPRQASLPAVDDAGRIVLASRSRIALAPNGHGGLYSALRDAKLLDLLADHGVRTLATCQVDNPLIRTADPEFVGFHVLRGSQFSSKSVAKRSASEKVGVFARCGGRACVVEYSELTPEQSAARDANGDLVFGQGNIAAHCIDLAFARDVARDGLPYHRARKKVPYADAAGAVVDPPAPNAWKFESFVFDALPRAERSFVLETSRADEFSPIKNADGEDSPESARRDLIAQFRGWHERAGLPSSAPALEVSPLEAPDEESFRAARGIRS